jgi:DNA-binding MarR family transcriptional regulator
MAPGELAAAERLQPQSLTRALARLKRDGLVAREPDREDRRR